jgi:hypothetical protein
MSHLSPACRTGLVNQVSDASNLARQLRLRGKRRALPSINQFCGKLESAPFRGTSGIASRTDLARLATSGSPHLVASILWPLPDRQLHKYQPAGPRDARERRHNLLAVHVARGAN